ncbi:MAG: ThiF family adenylyltransferase, partial [Planctomycetota bacterium]
MDTFFRQADILGLDDLEGFDVDIVGAGSLGGAILICLGKMGFGIRNRLTVTDFDRCEAHNLATQWFAPGHVLLNRPK